MLTGDDLTDAFAELLARHPDGEDALDLGYIDGALAGLLLVPDPVPDDEWLAKLGAGSDVAFADPLDRERFVGLFRDRKAEIAGELLQGGLAFSPVYGFDDDGRAIWQLWLLGLGSVLALRPDHWEAMLESDDEDMAAAAMGLMSLLAGLPGFAERLPEDENLAALAELAELAEQAEDLLPYFVETIYRRQHGLERVVMADGWPDDFDALPAPATPARSSKVGRNEPCPCGSGRKYKKCCAG